MADFLTITRVSSSDVQPDKRNAKLGQWLVGSSQGSAKKLNIKSITWNESTKEWAVVYVKPAGT